jgi:hypothetical protein
VSRRRNESTYQYLSPAHTFLLLGEAHQDLSLLDSPNLAWPHESEFNWDLSYDPFARSTPADQATTPDFGLGFVANPDDYATEALPDAPEETYTFDEMTSVEEPTIRDFVPGSALDLKADHSTTFIGYSNESDPFALNHFPFNERDEVDFFRVTYRKLSSKPSGRGGASTRPIHFLQSQTGTAVEARRVIDEILPNLDGRAELEAIVDNTAGVGLVKL